MMAVVCYIFIYIRLFLSNKMVNIYKSIFIPEMSVMSVLIKYYFSTLFKTLDKPQGFIPRLDNDAMPYLCEPCMKV